jgi:hypothetical protein
MGCNNLDVLEGVQRDKVGVTGDDMRSLSADGQIQKLVVFGSRQTAMDTDGSIHRASRARAVTKLRTFSSSKISPESFATQHLMQFRENCRGQQDLSLSKSKIEGLTGLRIGQQQELTSTFVSNTHRNYAPFSKESNISGVSLRAFALRPTSSSTCSSGASSPDVNYRSQRLKTACIFRFSSGPAAA